MTTDDRFHRGMKLYNDSWTTDNPPTPAILATPSAIKNLETAITLLEKALFLDPSNPEIQKYATLTRCKLCGDEILKRARTCQRQAASAFSQRDYQFSYTRYGDAMEDCCAAMDHYEEGLKKDEPRFKDSLSLVHDEIKLVLEGRDMVRPWKEAEVKKREFERPARKQLEEEKKREKWLEEVEKEQRRKQFGRGLLGTGAAVGTLALLSQGGPSSNFGGAAGTSHIGLNSHAHGDFGLLSGVAGSGSGASDGGE